MKVGGAAKTPLSHAVRRLAGFLAVVWWYLRIETRLLKIGHLLHKMGFARTEIAISVYTYDDEKITLKFEKFRRTIFTKLTLFYSKQKSALLNFWGGKI